MNTIKLNGTDVEYNNIYYIAVDGSDTLGNGTKSNPFATYDKAFTLATDNDLIYFIKGNYNITELNFPGTNSAAFLYDKNIQLTIYVEPFTYIIIDNPINNYLYSHCITIMNTNTKIIGFIFDWNVTNKFHNYARALFGNGENSNSRLYGYIYNCHFIIRSTTSFSYANFQNILQCINCQFDIKVTPEDAYSGATKFVNCTMNLASNSTTWGITSDSTILVNQSYTDKYKLVASSSIYGIYNGLYIWILLKFLIFDNNKYKYIDENNNTIIINNIEDLLNIFDLYGMGNLSKINPSIINVFENNSFNIKLLK